MLILDDVFEKLALLLNVEVYFNFAVSPDGSHLVLAAAHGITSEQRERLRRLEFGQAVCGAVAASRQAMVVPDVQGSTDPRTELIRSLGITAYSSWPLIANGKLLGTLSYGTRSSPRFNEEALRLLQTVCDYVALHPLPEAESPAAKTWSPEKGSDPLEEIVQVGVRLMAARHGALAILKEDEDTVARFFTAELREDGHEAAAPASADRDLLKALIRDPRPLRMKDISQVPRLAAVRDGQPATRSFVGVPLVSMKQVRGSLYFAEKRGAPEFRRTDERLAEALACVAVKAVESKWTYGEVRLALDALREAANGGSAVILSPSREIIYWNGEARGLFGYLEEEVLGRSFPELLLPAQDRPAWRRGWESQQRELPSRAFEFELTCLRKDGGGIPVRARMTPIRHNIAGISFVSSVCIFQRT